jgi:magnesium chelatase accessory protein
MGTGPVLLLAHGTGASTHSWRALAPLLAQRFSVVAPDLPRHGFTTTVGGRGASDHVMSLPGMAAALAALLDELGVKPEIAIGHSAGAAVLARMCLDGLIQPKGLVSLNGALRQIGGMAGRVFSPLARLLATTDVAARLFARHADARGVARLVRQTGSTLDPEGQDLYRRLASNPGHVAAALAMMANWDLAALERDLPQLQVPLLLIVGGNDRTVSPEDAYLLRKQIPGASVVTFRGLGHLSHEEQPARTADRIVAAAREWGVLRDAAEAPPQPD